MVQVGLERDELKTKATKNVGYVCNEYVQVSAVHTPV